MINFKKIRVNYRHSHSSRVSAITLCLLLWVGIINLASLQSEPVNFICGIIASVLVIFNVIWDCFLYVRFPSSPVITLRDHYFSTVSFCVAFIILFAGLFNRDIYPSWMGAAMWGMEVVTILYFALTKPGDKEPGFMKFRYFRVPDSSRRKD